MNKIAENELIKRYLFPLAKNFSGALTLSDDAAIISIPAGYELVITKDAISEGVHYIGSEHPALIARKLLRVNLSDLAAMGAKPYCYFLSIALPAPFSEEYIKDFASGLAVDQQEFSIYLAGGDTIASKSGAVFSITALGIVPIGKALRRNNAKIGDKIYVSGTIGDAALGLKIAESAPPILGKNHLQDRYLLPEPRSELGQKLQLIATSCTDISDGLLADMENICRASKVGAEIHSELIPLSAAALEAVSNNPQLWQFIYSGGDDYELLFTLPENINPPQGATLIGKITQGNSAILLKDGKAVAVTQKGYLH